MTQNEKTLSDAFFLARKILAAGGLRIKDERFVITEPGEKVVTLTEDKRCAACQTAVRCRHEIAVSVFARLPEPSQALKMNAEALTVESLIGTEQQIILRHSAKKYGLPNMDGLSRMVFETGCQSLSREAAQFLIDFLVELEIEAAFAEMKAA